MVEKSNQTKQNFPELVNNTTVAKWNKSIKVHADQVFGARKATLEYLLRTNYTVVDPHPPLILDYSYSAAAGSIQGEHTFRLSLNHLLYRDNNKSFFVILELALRGNTYEAPINPFKSTGNHCGAYKSSIVQHAGKDKLVNILRDSMTYVNERKLDGTTSYLLQEHIENAGNDMWILRMYMKM